jgi:4-diphosphocytidyl-2-C-methyl-D-erythritol kinase
VSGAAGGRAELVEVVAQSPAKVNLCLSVGSARPDGYHPLATVYQAIGLYDEVTVSRSEEEALTLGGEDVDLTDVPTDGSNLALRAARLLAGHHALDRTVSIHLHKRIPVAGGLAGGSTDAAGALVACDALWGLGTPRETLLELAAELGSDVPFCLLGGTVLGSGRGELVTPVPCGGELWWTVVPTEGGLSTAGVYGEFDRLTEGAAVVDPVVPDALLAALRDGDAHRLGRALENDLAPAALSLRPDLAETIAAGLAAGALGALVSGSGPTTVFLCDGPGHAARVDRALQTAVGTAPGLVAPAPVAGARVVGSRPAGVA